MDNEQRAEKLAQAIEELLRGGQPDLDDAELQELLYLAKIRREAGLTAADAGSQHENSVWQRLLTKLRELKEQTQQEEGGLALDPPGDDAAADDPEARDIRQLSEVIRARRALAEQYVALSEEHRDVVWQRVQARLEAHEAEKRRSPRALRLPFLSRHRREADELATAVDGMLQGQALWEASDSRVRELIALARLRRAMGQVAGASGSAFEGRLWARIRPRLIAQQRGSVSAVGRARPRWSWHLSFGTSPWPKLAAAAAMILLVIFAIGPLPATGLADHPFNQILRFVSQRVGVTETGDAPAISHPLEVVEGIPVTLEEAQTLLGLPVREPTHVPDNFEKTRSLFFPGGSITAEEAGMLMLAYERPTESGDAPTIIIYQERTSANTVAVKTGFAESVTIASGIQGTYVEGTWTADSDFQIVWDEDGGQSLVFDNGPVRTIILYVDGPKMDVNQFTYIAMSMLDLW